MGFYEGAWRRQTGWPRGRPPADLVDAEHLQPPDGPVDASVTGPRVEPIPAYLLAEGAAEDAGWGVRSTGRVVPGVPVDRTPDGHNHGTPTGGPMDDERASRQANRARGQDQGAVAARRRRVPDLRAVDETFVTELRETHTANHQSSRQIEYQRWSRPENMTDTRHGREVFRWADRKLPTRWRRTTLRPLPTGTAATVSASPPLPGANQYVSPFGTLMSGRTRVAQRPQVRRVPRPWDEEIVADGTDSLSAPTEFQSWGL